MQYILKSLVGAAVVLAFAFTATPAVALPEGIAVEAPTLRDGDVFYGQIDAPVTIVEYASLTCSHCAAFHGETLSKLKAGPIAEGKMRLVYRDFPLDGLALRASALSRCGGPERRLPILDLLFQSQGSWARSQDPLSALAQIGKLAGLKEEQSRACMEDSGMLDRIVAERQEGEDRHGVRSTPSFVVDQTLYRGDVTVDDFTELLDQLAK